MINKDDARCFSLADGEKNCRATVIPFSRKEHLEVGAFIKDNNIVIRDPEGKDFCVLRNRRTADTRGS